SYEHSFAKKYDSHKLYIKVEFRSVFRAPSQNFKILTIPNVLANGKSYEHGFTKKHDGHKLCVKSRVKSSFYRFFMPRLGYQNIGHPQRISPLEVLQARFTK
ncbi:hypothetical protein BHM03_00053916, partial [Ensete ventricosum]